MLSSLIKKIQNDRSVVIDLELTDPKTDGNERIVEIGITELFNGKRLGNQFHKYIDAGKPSNPEALSIHGLTAEFLAQYPNFRDQAEDILGFIEDAPIIHHCWLSDDGEHSVDERFMQDEMVRASKPVIPHSQWLNIKLWAKQISPDQNSLNDMLKRYNLNPEERKKSDGTRSALNDSELTARLYPHIQNEAQQLKII